MSWCLVLVLGAGAYACKSIGLVLVGDRQLRPVIDRCLALIPAALLSALIVKDTFSTGKHLVLDARASGVAVAVVAAWRRAPLVVVVALALRVAAQSARA